MGGDGDFAFRNTLISLAPFVSLVPLSQKTQKRSIVELCEHLSRKQGAKRVNRNDFNRKLLVFRLIYYLCAIITEIICLYEIQRV